MAEVSSAVVERVPEVTGCDAVAQSLSQFPGWDPVRMLAIARAENGSCDPLHHNLTQSENHRVCIGSYGVLQVGCLHFKDSEDRNDLRTQVAVAHRVWLMQGYEAWSTYNNNKYKEFLR